ncbi:MAG: hypothetical protein H7Y11_01265, partial [Armatimonadetes bacterium]|nr:hypothetical protein [Anaerolineae bacterium]
MFSEHFTFTKRQLGLALLVIGVLGVIGLLALDVVFSGREGGIGPAQRTALVVMAGAALVGLSL